MGGFGSGRWYGRERREVVERCLSISSDDLSLISRPFEEQLLPVRRHDRRTVITLSCRSASLANGTLALDLELPMGDNCWTQTIPLGSTQARAGGSRNCFLCPIPEGDGYCGRPSRKLFIPPRTERFGCRKCCRLSYSSSQRRQARLARSDAVADRIIKEADELLDAAAAGEDADFWKVLRTGRRLSHVYLDQEELLSQSVPHN